VAQKRTFAKRLTLVNAQEETWRARLDCEWVATAEVLRDVLTSADRDRCKLLKIAGGCAIICCWTARRSAVRARMPEASGTGLNCRRDPLGQASRPDLMRLLRLSPVRMQGLTMMLQLGTPAAASAASAW
jgi:hypothetical protein